MTSLLVAALLALCAAVPAPCGGSVGCEAAADTACDCCAAPVDAGARGEAVCLDACPDGPLHPLEITALRDLPAGGTPTLLAGPAAPVVAPRPFRRPAPRARASARLYLVLQNLLI